MSEIDRSHHHARLLFLFVILVVVLTIIASGIPLGYLPKGVEQVVSITVDFYGAFEEDIERLITEPLEDELARLPGVKRILSVSEMEKCRVLTVFQRERSLDRAYLDVREAVSRAYTEFPSGVQRPVISKSDTASRPVFVASFPTVGELTEADIKRLLENVDGTGQVEVSGGAHHEIEILYGPERLSAVALSHGELISALRRHSLIGAFHSNSRRYVMDQRLTSARELRTIPITPELRLGELARVEETEVQRESLASVAGQEQMIVYVREAGDANTVELCRRLRNQLSGTSEARILYDRGATIAVALREVCTSAAIGAGAVILLTILFIRHGAAALLVSINIPFSALTACAFLRMTGHELDLLTLAGLAVGIGLVIDTGIIYVEAFREHDARITETRRSVLAPIVFSTITTVAVFVPLLFAPVELAQQFGGLALAIAVSATASWVFVFVFMPAFLEALWHTPTGEIRRARETTLAAGRRLFMVLHRHRALIALVLVALVAFAAHTAVRMPRQQFSFRPGKSLRLNLEYPSGTPMAVVWENASWLETHVLADRTAVSVAATYRRERAEFDVTLVDSAARGPLQDRIRALAPRFPDAFLFFPEEETLDTSFDIVFTGSSNRRLRELGGELASRLSAIPTAEQVVLHYKTAAPSLRLNVDLHRAVSMGLDPRDVYRTVHWALARPVAAKWNHAGEELDIRVAASGAGDPSLWTLEEALRLPLLSSFGDATNVGSVVEVSEREESGRIYHHDRQRSISLSIHSTGGDRRRTLDEATRIARSFPLPQDYALIVAPDDATTTRLARAAVGSLALAVLLIGLILLFQYESLRIPLIIAAQIPLTYILPVLALSATATPLTLPVVIGLVLTTGVTVNNSILVFSALKGSHLTAVGTYHAFRRQLRPILMASVTTVVGILPLALAQGESSGVLAPMSATIALGVVGSIGVLFLTIPLGVPGPVMDHS